MTLDAHFASSLFVALLMGFFSSLHCIGMCGSIIGTLTLTLDAPVRQDKRRLLPFIFCYNAGRITSYALAGGIMGLLEFVVTLPLGDAHGHRFLQIISAIFMAGAGFYIAGWFAHFAYVERLGVRLWQKVEPCGRKLMPIRSIKNAYLFGLVWGLLPCGLVYAALALTLATGNGLYGMLTMIAFGLGTLPAVMGVGIMTGFMVKLAKSAHFRQLVGIFMIFLALFAAFPWLNPMAMINAHPLHAGN